MNPNEVLRQEGLEIASGVTYKVLESTSAAQYLVLGREFTLSHEHLATLVATVGKALPVPEAHELRLVQSTEATRYIALPYVPGGAFKETMTDAELLTMAGGGMDAVVTGEQTLVQTATTVVTNDPSNVLLNVVAQVVSVATVTMS